MDRISSADVPAFGKSSYTFNDYVQECARDILEEDLSNLSNEVVDIIRAVSRKKTKYNEKKVELIITLASDLGCLYKLVDYDLDGDDLWKMMKQTSNDLSRIDSRGREVWPCYVCGKKCFRDSHNVQWKRLRIIPLSVSSNADICNLRIACKSCVRHCEHILPCQYATSIYCTEKNSLAVKENIRSYKDALEIFDEEYIP